MMKQVDANAYRRSMGENGAALIPVAGLRLSAVKKALG